MHVVHPQPAALLLLAALALNGCGQVSREGQVSALEQRILLGREVIGAAAGGTIASNLRLGLHEGVELAIPPNALEQDTEISLFVRYGDPRFPSAVQTFELEPTPLRLAVPAMLTIEYAGEYERVTETVFSEGAIEVFSVGDRDLVHFPAKKRDRELNGLSAEVDRFGTFVAMHAQMQALLFQEPRIVDPQEAITLKIVQGQAVTSKEGDQSVFVGKGSLDSFWSSGAGENLLLIHGLLGTPFHLQSQNSFAPVIASAGFNQNFANIVVYQYPSGRSLADNANRLYDTIMRSRRAGFGCNVLAHSSGGLLARYAIERSHLDPRREGYSVEDQPLGSRVPRLVTVGTPNQGSSQIRSIFSRMLRHMTDTDQPLVQGILDVLPGIEGFPSILNTDWVKPETRYFAIAGDVNGTRTDGLVEVLSAIGLPAAWSRPDSYQVFSGPLYDHNALSAVAARTGVLQQAQAWLGKAPSNTPPTVGSVLTPTGISSGEISIPFALTDHQGDSCQVIGEFSLNNRVWFPATPAGGGSPTFTAVAREAPGQPHVFQWDSVADGFAPGRRLRVWLRFRPSDSSGPGTTGQTGPFVVLN